MARDINQKLKGNLPEAKLNIGSFNKGLITLVSETLIPTSAAKESRNLMQTMDGRWTTRWGTDTYGTSTGGTIYGAGTYTTDAGATHLLVATGTSIKRSTDDGATWSTCTGATMTAGNKVNFLQIGSYCYIANGVDNLVRYDGTTTLQVYTSLTTPTGTSLGLTGLTSGSYNAYYKVSAVNSVGETAASAEATTTMNKERDNWTTGTDYITVTFNRVTGASYYNIYFSTRTGEEVYLDSIADPGTGSTVAYQDRGTVALNDLVVAPVSNTTTGPKFSEMELSGNRIWATLDPNNPWRVYWSGTGQYQGAFSEYYGGGYVDLEKGGRERPKKVVHYRDGKGGAYATVLTSDPEGNGSIWQISLDSVTIGTTSFTVPTAVKIVGSVGTSAPGSVSKVRNDIFFFNRRGWFSLGSRPQMLNLLSTDEISSNIRPDIQAMQGSALDKVTSYFYDAKCFVSMPYGSDTNNVIYVNDTERKNWSGPWTVGVERFFEYADTDGNNHLLAVPTSGNTLLEVSSNITGDEGAAFDTRYLSGLYPVTQDRNAFAKIRYVYFELFSPVGDIQLSVLGTEKKRGFNQIRTVSITGSQSGVGYGTQAFSSFSFSDTSTVPNTFSLSSIKKRVRVNRLLNNIQFKITTSGRGDSYVLVNIQAKGFVIPTGDPQSWKSTI